jgi:O-antigen ligase
MASTVKLEVGAPSQMAGGRSLIAELLVAVAVLATLFFGVVGEDKGLLIAPLTLAGYAALALWLVGSAFSRHETAAAPPGFFFFLLFIAYGAVVGLLSMIPYEARWRMLSIGLYVGAYFVWSNAFSLFRRSRGILGWVLFLALLACFYGLVNFFKQPDQVLWTERYFTYEGRLASTYICPNHFAHLLQMLLPFCLVLLFIPQAGWLLRILAGYCIVVYIPVICLTESRAGMLGAMAAVGTTVCLAALRRSKKLFALLVLLVPLSAILLLWGAWSHSEMFHRRMEPVVTFLAEAKEDGFANTQTRDFRPLTWLDTIEMIGEKPLTGFGPGSYRYLFPEYRKRFAGNQVVTGHPHNEFLEVAAEYGLVGFGLLALAWGVALIRLLLYSLKTQNRHHAFMAMAFLGTAAGTLVHSFFDFQLYVFQNALVFALLAAIAAGPICGRRQETLMKQKDQKPVRRLPAVISGFALALLVLAALVPAVPVFSSAFLRAVGSRLAEQRRPEPAMKYYERALKVDPENWRAYKGMGALYFKERYYTLEPEEKRRLGLIEQACFADGYLHNPKDATLVFDLGMATVFLGDVDEGIRRLQEATRLKPFNDVYWLRLGIEQRRAGLFDEALATFRYAQSLNNTPMARKNIEWIERMQQAPPPDDEAAPKPGPIDLELPDIGVTEKDALQDLLELMDSSGQE